MAPTEQGADGPSRCPNPIEDDEADGFGEGEWRGAQSFDDDVVTVD